MGDDHHPCEMPAEGSYAASAGLWTCVCERHWRRGTSGEWREIRSRALVPFAPP